MRSFDRGLRGYCDVIVIVPSGTKMEMCRYLSSVICPLPSVICHLSWGKLLFAHLLHVGLTDVLNIAIGLFWNKNDRIRAASSRLCPLYRQRNCRKPLDDVEVVPPGVSKDVNFLVYGGSGSTPTDRRQFFDSLKARADEGHS